VLAPKRNADRRARPAPEENAATIFGITR